MCRNCVDAHEQLGPVSEHVLVSVKELQRKRHNPMMQQHQQCKKHPNQDLTLYCKDAKCKALVCASCCLVELVVATEEIKTDLRESLLKVQIKARELANTQAMTKSLQKRLTDDFKRKQGSMEECEQELVELIKDRFNKANHYYNHLYESEMKDLQEKLNSTDSLMAQMISACDFASKACEVSNTTRLLDSQNQIKDRLSELENIRLPKADVAYKRNFNFTNIHYLALKQIRGAIPNLCDVPKSSIWRRLIRKLSKILPPLVCVSVLLGIPLLIFLSYRAHMRGLAQVKPSMTNPALEDSTTIMSSTSEGPSNVVGQALRDSPNIISRKLEDTSNMIVHHWKSCQT